MAQRIKARIGRGVGRQADRQIRIEKGMVRIDVRVADKSLYVKVLVRAHDCRRHLRTGAGSGGKSNQRNAQGLGGRLRKNGRPAGRYLPEIRGLHPQQELDTFGTIKHTPAAHGHETVHGVFTAPARALVRLRAR